MEEHDVLKLLMGENSSVGCEFRIEASDQATQKVFTDQCVQMHALLLFPLQNSMGRLSWWQSSCGLFIESMWIVYRVPSGDKVCCRMAFIYGVSADL